MSLVKALLDMLYTKVGNGIIFSYRDLVRFRHGEKSDICMLTGDGHNFIRFDTTNSDGTITLAALNSMRKMVGENVLGTYGLPVDEEIPHIYLLPMPSAIRTIGLRRLIDFYKNNWVGDSKVGDLTVVVYK